MYSISSKKSQKRTTLYFQAQDICEKFHKGTSSIQEIMNTLTMGCSPAKPQGRIEKISRLENGKTQMSFSGPQGFVYIIEASSDLIKWESIGVATDLGEGNFQFEATASPAAVRSLQNLAPVRWARAKFALHPIRLL